MADAMSAADRAATQKKILNRLKRARGQLDAVVREVESGGSCRDVVTQLAAVSRALDRAGFTIIASAMKDCLADSEDAEDTQGAGRAGRDRDMTAEELEKLFLTLA